MINGKELESAEMCKKDGQVEGPELGIVKPDANCEGFTKHSTEPTLTNSDANPATGNIEIFQEEHQMTQEEFWAINDSSLVARDQEEQIRLVKAELIKRSNIEIVSFDNILRKIKGKAACWKIWGAGRIIKGYCYGKNFDSFLLWMISKGQSVYENALKSPDSLAGVITQRDIDEGVNFERLSYIAWDVYKEKTGVKMWNDRRSISEPENDSALEDADEMSLDIEVDLYRKMGKTWDFYNLKEMNKRYPKLLQGFLDCYLHLTTNGLKGKKLGWVSLNGEMVESHQIVVI